MKFGALVCTASTNNRMHFSTTWNVWYTTHYSINSPNSGQNALPFCCIFGANVMVFIHQILRLARKLFSDMIFRFKSNFVSFILQWSTSLSLTLCLLFLRLLPFLLRFGTFDRSAHMYGIHICIFNVCLNVNSNIGGFLPSFLHKNLAHSMMRISAYVAYITHISSRVHFNFLKCAFVPVSVCGWVSVCALCTLCVAYFKCVPLR